MFNFYNDEGPKARVPPESCLVDIEKQLTYPVPAIPRVSLRSEGGATSADATACKYATFLPHEAVLFACQTDGLLVAYHVSLSPQDVRLHVIECFALPSLGNVIKLLSSDTFLLALGGDGAMRVLLLAVPSADKLATLIASQEATEGVIKLAGAPPGAS